MTSSSSSIVFLLLAGFLLSLSTAVSAAPVSDCASMWCPENGDLCKAYMNFAVAIGFPCNTNNITYVASQFPSNSSSASLMAVEATCAVHTQHLRLVSGLGDDVDYDVLKTLTRLTSKASCLYVSSMRQTCILLSFY